ncbi:DUF3304 domain-containing protein [Klebsiella aerogenes]|uniref:DUF3304 domain-containing protein n=1 Tax=Klebsiella aerogenes TaxID=548 RepID=UPI00277BACCD|nr:DUF3304 domain-containing protein [Klebsiella aerogenes]HCR0141971.1 DUF3304 domain-containing protein [Klebsiella aerogenes]HDS7116935.1 DUF3304 domain-containing protein [Klebsiella aerogenes]
MNNIKRMVKGVAVLAVLALLGCTPSQADESSAGALSGINHVAVQGINWFTVNGYRATLAGESCCVMIPDQWKPGLRAHVEWEVDPNPHAHLPPLGTEEYNKAYIQHKAKYQHYSADILIPQYKESAGIVVHFLPCHQVKIYAGISSYGASNYPIKEPLDMKEPATCQK